MPGNVGITERTYRKATPASRFGAAALGCLLLAGCASQSATAPPSAPAVSTRGPGFRRAIVRGTMLGSRGIPDGRKCHRDA